MNSRQITLDIIRDININKSYSNISIEKHLPRDIEIIDENFIREMVYGLLENYIYIDYILAKASNIKLAKLNPIILDILRISLYQMIFMDKVPDRAAIFEGVELAKKHGHKGLASFTNGVLRNISRNKDKFISIEERDKVDYLSVKYSHKRWLVEYLLDNYDYDFTENILKYNNKKPSFNIRSNTLKITRDELMEILKDKGFKLSKTKISKDGIIIENPSRITRLKEFKEGLFTIQDEASMVVSETLDPKKNSLVLDMCSAPGGKTTHLGQIMNNSGKILAYDIYKNKIRLVEENAKRLGVTNIETKILDGRLIDDSLINKLDYCLIDAPCSGLGVIRRKPDIKLYREEEDLDDLVSLQRKLLVNGEKYIKTGGYLLYSTCTIGKKENMDNVTWFLNQFNNFKLIEKIELFPHLDNTDGFFIAKFIKNNI